MRSIPRTRFDAIAGYARDPKTPLYAEEVAYFDHANGRILGALIRDRTDGDFGGIVFAPDRRLRYRCVHVSLFHDSPRRAEIALRRKMEEASGEPPEAHFQDDEVGEPVDFFAPRRPRAKLHPDFIKLSEEHGYSPARMIIEPMMRWFDDVDGNFIEQFQTSGFDQRIWELYLFASFTEMGYILNRRDAVPDFLLEGPFGNVAVEAVTVAASAGGKLGDPPDARTLEGKMAFLRHYMPIKFGSALFSKLQKRYWEKPNVAGEPLVFAIEDFSAPGSMIYTRSALHVYLYGVDHTWEHSDAGELIITPHRVTEHRWGEKVIPSGFFNQTGADNVSAVLFSNSGTIAKFNRMGVTGGFGGSDVLLIREGTAVDPNPNAAVPLTFQHVVNDPAYEEDWGEGLEVFHNPKAKIPLDPRTIPGATSHRLSSDGQIITTSSGWQPLGSRTMIYAPVDVAVELERRGLV